MNIERGIMFALEYGRLSKEMDSFVLELPNGGSVSFIDRDGDVDSVMAERPEGECANFSGRLRDGIVFAKGSK